MIAHATLSNDEEAPVARFAVTPAIEIGVILSAIAIALVTYWIVRSQALVAPPIVASLLAINLVPGIIMLMLLGRRVAKRRAANSPVGGGGRLHVRLVAIFSLIASVPIVLTVITASILFQSSAQFWVSDRAKQAFGDAMGIARDSQKELINRWVLVGRAMASDLGNNLSIDDRETFHNYMGNQTVIRELEESVLFSYGAKEGFKFYDFINQPAEGEFRTLVTPEMIASAQRKNSPEVGIADRRIWVVTPIPGRAGMFLYTATSVNANFLSQQHFAAEDVVKDYLALQDRSRVLQLKFNLVLFAVALFIVGIAVWIALAVADRLVRPVGELVDAARRVAGGDLTARVPDTRARDEVGTLAKAFNQMTGRLQEQNTDLVTANDQLESRRALIEAVMADVSAGVVATGEDRTIRIANRSATQLLGAEGLVGRSLADVAPELDHLVEQRGREAIVQVGHAGEARTLAVRIAHPATGPILTFDDITQQLLDQRRAAWSDVARRIAHEIKNPLTPIQLAAERLQRRYGGKIDAEDGTFARLTDTIIRQVADLRRMVDEFSSFARMPKPVFREESLLDAARQAMFLHEVAHPGIRFLLVHDDPGPMLVCDRRQIGQALTNIVKNAVEAIEAAGETADGGGGAVTMTLTEEPGRTGIVVADTGIGLPADRDRIVEPYVTTRARGTGLGLAIVKKIIEEHCGTIAFSDRPGGGTIVTMVFDVDALAALDQGASPPEPAGEGQLGAQLVTMTRNRT